MYDIHMHLIPGVDDGAVDSDMALCMALEAWNQGVQGIFATPHSSAFSGDPETVRFRFDRMRRVLHRVGGPELYYGCEVYCEQDNMPEVLAGLIAGRIPTMNGTSLVLTEFSPWEDGATALFCAEKLLNAGFTPIIAHAERCSRLDGGTVERLKAMGCYIQINVYSVYEEQEAGIREAANRMLKNRQVDFLGSDAHRTWHRPPSVRRGLQYLYETYPKAYIDRIAVDNPRRLLVEQSTLSD